MTFVVVVNPPSREFYERVSQSVDLAGDPPPGLLFHTASESNNGVLVVDVWESRAAAEDFANNRLMPAISSSGLMAEGQRPPGPLYELEPFDEWHPTR